MTKSNGAATKLTRRGFLGAASAGALAVTATIKPGARAASAKDSRFDYDVIVVGGGFAGVTAARDLVKEGLRTVIVEARNRLGGRTLTADFGNHKIDLGGTWIHWYQPYVWAEVTRYGLPLADTPGAQPERIFWRLNGVAKSAEGMELLPPLIGVFQAIFHDAPALWERPFDQAYSWPLITSMEPLTMRGRLDQVGLDRETRMFAEGMIATMSHATMDQTSYVEMARWYACGGGNLLTLLDSTGRYKFKEGTASLINAMIADATPEIMLGTVVKRVERTNDHVAITTEDGETITARAVINTIPMNVLKDVEFAPALAPIKMQASQETHCAVGFKFYAQTKSALGNILAVDGDGAPISLAWTYANEPDATILVGFGPRSDVIDPNDTDALQAALGELIPGIKLDSSVGYHWLMDPYAQGTYCSYRPGQLPRFGNKLFQHEGRLFEASGDHGEGWRGFIDGAIARGIRVAQEVSAYLNAPA